VSLLNVASDAYEPQSWALSRRASLPSGWHFSGKLIAAPE